MAGYTIVHCHSDHSLKDSPQKIKDLVSRAVEVKAESVTLTDHGTCTGVIDFMNECKKKGINGIPGVEAYVKTPWAAHAHMVLLAKNYEGYQAISRAITEANNHLVNIGGIMSPIMNMDIIRKYCSEGNVIATSACVLGVLASIIRYNDNTKVAIEKQMAKLSKYNSPFDEEYLQSVEMEQNFDKTMEALKQKRDELQNLAKKKYAARLKKLKSLGEGAPEYELAYSVLKKEMDETEAAAAEIEVIKAKMQSIKKTRSEVHEKVKTLSATHDKYRETAETIENLKRSLASPEELYNQAKQFAQEFVSIFGPDDFYIELQNHGFYQELEVYPILAKLAKELGIKVVAANDSHISRKEDAPARQIIKALRFLRWEPIEDSDREMYVKTEKQLYNAIAAMTDHDTAKEAILNAREIGQKCHVEIPNTPHYPKYIDETAVVQIDAKELLRQKAEEGIKTHYPNGFPNEEVYRARLEHELQVICDLGFADYLLVVADYVQYAKQYAINDNQYKVGYGIGPGRGSAAGSLVCYLIGITTVDPMQYNLLFERFLNKERVSMPDIDVDFSAEVREPTIEYVKKKYGDIACIRTAMTQGAKAAIRNCARLRGIELYGPNADRDFKSDMTAMRNLGDKMAKLVPNTPKIKLADCEADIRREFGSNEDAMVILERAKAVEDTITGLGVHAAGIIISDGTPLCDIVPLLYNTEKQQWVVQCDMVEAEANMKLLKMDFLGLNNLDIITECVRKIKKDRGEDIPLDNLPFEPEIFRDIFTAANTQSVFQFESEGMRRMLKEFQPESFEDIILLVAAYRPGPMEFIPDIIAVKHGRKEPKYIVPELENILSVTYGQPVYQEQLMDIFHKCAGFSLGEADIIRRHMSKKHVEEFLAYKPQFVNGIVNMGASEADANELWDSLTGFAKYGFNKSHATTYAMISYQTAYLKYHYPVEYMCAVLNNTKVDKLPEILAECRKMGIRILPPSVNDSEMDFSVVDGCIVYGLEKIKTFDHNNASLVITEREANGRYSSVQNFLTRTKMSETACEKLIITGAMDCFTKNRRGLLYHLPEFMKHMDVIKKKTVIIAEVTPELQEAADYEEALRKELAPVSENGEEGLFFMGVSEEYHSEAEEELKIAEKDRKSLEKKIANAQTAIKAAEAAFDTIEMADVGTDTTSDFLSKEHDLLGAYISSHPMEQYENMYAAGKVSRIADADVGTVTVAGIITNLRVTRRKSDNSEMAFFDLEDTSGYIHVNCFTRAYANFKTNIAEGAVVKVMGEVKLSKKETKDGEEEEKEKELFLKNIATM